MPRSHRTVTIALVAATALALGACASADSPDPEAEAETDTQLPSVTAEVVTDELDVPREVFELGDGTLLVSDQAGRVVVLEDGELRAEPFLDVTDRVMPPTRDRLELGLAGFELSPDFAETGEVYTFTTEAAEGVDRVDRIIRWTADLDTLVVDPASAEVVLEHEADGLDHVGGELELDDDGLLYASFGVAGAGHDAQDTASLAGTIIRIDPHGGEAGGEPYGIPDDNPFVDGGGRPEIYSYGYRNPWRLDWDAELGLVVAEAMWTTKHQQVSIPLPGDDAGFPLVGQATDVCWDDGVLVPSCDVTADGVEIAPPVLEYGPDVGQIASAAVVLEGTGIDGLEGVLVTDWRGAMLLATPGDAPWAWQELEPLADLGTSTLWDAQQEGAAVYLMTTSGSMNAGELLRLVEA